MNDLEQTLTAIEATRSKLLGMGHLVAEVHEDAHVPCNYVGIAERVSGSAMGSRSPGQGDRASKRAYEAAFNGLQRTYRDLVRIAKHHEVAIVDWKPQSLQVPSPRQFMGGAIAIAGALAQIGNVAPTRLVRLSRTGRIVDGPCLQVERSIEHLTRAAVSPRGFVLEPEGDFEEALASQIRRWKDRGPA